jgi:hypothetical protein
MAIVAVFVAILFGLMAILVPLVGVSWAFAITFAVAICAAALAEGYAER